MSIKTIIFFIEWCNDIIPLLLLYAIFMSILFFIGSRIAIYMLKLKEDTILKVANLFSLTPIFLFILFMLFIIFLPAVLHLI